MDGLRRRRTRQSALTFAEGLMAFVEARADAVTTKALGPTGLRLQFQSSSPACAFAADAFLRSDAETSVGLALAQAAFADIDVPLEWSRPWLPSNVPVPAELTHPYRIYLDHFLGFIHVFDSRTRRASILLRPSAELDGRTLVAPFRTSMNWLARSAGAAVIHAAAVSVNGHGVVIAGRSGSGKSTAAVGLAQAGHGILGDDSVVLSPQGVHALYRRAKLVQGGSRAAWWPGDAEVPVPQAPTAKRIIALDRARVDFRRESSVDLVLLPQIARRLAMNAVPRREAIDVIMRDAEREVKDRSPRDHQVVATALQSARTARVNIPSALESVQENYEQAIEGVLAHG